MKIIKIGTDIYEEKHDDLLSRRRKTFEKYAQDAAQLIEEYKEDREEALIRYAKDFDGIVLAEDQLWVNPDQIKNAHKLISPKLKQSIENVINRIMRFQQEMKLSPFQTQEEAGIYWGLEVRPLDRVGIYVPKNYFLTFILAAVPAKIAGVEEILIATPPEKKLGPPFVDPAILYVAKYFEINKILISGGVGGMAAMAYGTNSSMPVEKIVGPTRKLGLVAKLALSADVGIDGFTGPSELAFLCDKQSSYKAVAADIVALADHNPDAEVIVLNTEESWMENLLEEIISLIQDVKDPKGREGIRTCLESNTNLFLMDDLESELRFCNELAPGVLCLMTKEASTLIGKVKRCGSLLVGQYAPAVSIDIVGGATGLVSTLGASAFIGATTPASYVRHFGVLEIEKSALSRLQNQSLELSKAEGFSTHGAVFESRSL